jgi:cathepsin L
LSNNTDIIKSTLATAGPLSVCVDAYKWSLYVSGIFNDCHDSETDHAVLLVGYQDDGAWIIKNSWGTTWG